MKERDLFPPLKKHFVDMGYKVYAEVPFNYRGIDFVAVRGDEQIAVEMKMIFNAKVCFQARQNQVGFGKSYVAFPSKRLFQLGNDDWYWKQREKRQNLIDICEDHGIGILQVIQPHNTVVEVAEAKYEKLYRLFDFSQYQESEDDEAGLPFQRGVSAGYYELKLIKEYVRNNPKADWKEIYQNVQNHYSSPQSLSGSMSQWRGFSLSDFKKQLTSNKEK